MQQETFVIGTKEFTCLRMNPFEANRLLMRVQKVVLPIIGTIGGKKSLLDLDVKEAAAALSQHLDESVMDTIVLPMFAEAKVYSTEDKRFIKDATGINLCFTTENLFDLYELIWLVGRFQFEPFFVSMMERFGKALADRPAHESPASLPKA